VAIVRLFASARAAAGRSRDDVPGATVAEVLATAGSRYGAGFRDVLDTCTVWVNGEPAEPSTGVTASDEIAVLPPVSGGSA
jgi:molybdopterin converting factor small subunit